ncbi:MAG: hypothetical protein J0I81_02300 [Hyphomicrobium sp.]|nr:hypothetical protein [Hyphomicrobium sp.]
MNSSRCTNGTPLGKYQINAFYPGGTKDRYESTAWTINGKIADLLSVVYTGSYMVRHIDGQQDKSVHQGRLRAMAGKRGSSYSD